VEISWMQILGSLAIAGAAGCSAAHALLHKRDPPAGLGWVAVCLLFPVAGPVLYFFFGINRIQRRARKLQQEARERNGGAVGDGTDRGPSPSPHRLATAALSAEQILDRVPPELHDLARVSSAVSQWQLVGGNSVELLHNGEQVYPRMLEAIANARRNVYLTTYIFETDATGLEIIDALEEAHRRGVDVRVIVDAIGEIYSLPWASRVLRQRGIPVHRFIQPRWFPPTVHLNLRNHRKILVVDGTVGFTGGMNLGGRHLVDKPSGRRVVDLHCRLTGPIVGQLQEVFLDDWFFVGGGSQRAASGLEEEPAAGRSPAGQSGVDGCLCRVITDGPDEDLDKLLAVILGAISGARRRVWIMTPYFLPPRALTGMLQSVALRGVDVRILLPSKSDVPIVDWATRNHLWELLERGVRCFLRAPPFAHSKLLVVDDAYVQIGSSNLDPRSLRLNFELAVEIFSREFARRAVAHCEEVAGSCEELTRDDLDDRPLWVRLRDAVAWLFSPYL
jgi:cardiolipin synthase